MNRWTKSATTAVRRRVRAELSLPISIGVARTKHLAKIASQVAKPDGLVVVDPETELDFLHDLPVELMWGVGPVTQARLAEIGVHTIGRLAKMPGYSLERLLGHAAGEKLTALAWNRDPREISTHPRAQSAGAQSALGKKPAEEQVLQPTLRHLADRVASRLRAKSRPGRTVTVRVRFADLHSVTRSVTLDAPISATATLAEIAEELVRAALADHPKEKTISLLAISVSHLEKHWKVQLELPLGLEDEKRRPGTERGMARFPMSFANSPKRTCRPLAMTLLVLSLPVGNQSRGCPYVRRIVRPPVLRCAFPHGAVFGYIGRRMIKSSRSRFTLPQRRYSTRRTSNSRNIRVSPQDRSRIRRTLRSYQPICTRPQHPQAVFLSVV